MKHFTIVILCKINVITQSLDKFTIVFILCNILSLTHPLDESTIGFVLRKILSLTLGKMYHCIRLMQKLYYSLHFLFFHFQLLGGAHVFTLEH